MALISDDVVKERAKVGGATHPPGDSYNSSRSYQNRHLWTVGVGRPWSSSMRSITIGGDHKSEEGGMEEGENGVGTEMRMESGVRRYLFRNEEPEDGGRLAEEGSDRVVGAPMLSEPVEDEDEAQDVPFMALDSGDVETNMQVWVDAEG